MKKEEKSGSLRDDIVEAVKRFRAKYRKSPTSVSMSSRALSVINAAGWVDCSKSGSTIRLLNVPIVVSSMPKKQNRIIFTGGPRERAVVDIPEMYNPCMPGAAAADNGIKALESCCSEEVQKQLAAVKKPSSDILDMVIEFGQCEIRLKAGDVLRGMFHHNRSATVRMLEQALATLPLGIALAARDGKLAGLNREGLSNSMIAGILEALTPKRFGK